MGRGPKATANHVETDDTAFGAGTRFGKYQIVRLLGEGGMGAVYEAVHTELRKKVALKTLHPKLAAIPEATARFRREGEAASRIQHPHVVDVTDVGEHAGTPYLVMEYLQGETLGQHLRRRGALPPEEAVDLLLPVIAAVAAGHEAGVIHRDLKPSNIMLAQDRARREVVPKVLDFGVSKLTGTDDAAQALTMTGAQLGTIMYMAPEQAVGANKVDARSDQYALGLIVYECVTGRRAYDGDNTFALLRRIGDGAIEPPRKWQPGLPESFEAALLQALARDPAGRFEDVVAFGRALLAFASERGRWSWRRVFARDTRGEAIEVPVESGRTPPPPAPVAPTQAFEPNLVPPTAMLPGAAVSGGTAMLPGRLTGTRLLEKDTAPSTMSGLSAELVIAPPTGRSRRTLWFVVGGVVVLSGVGLAAMWLRDPVVVATPTAAPPPAPAAVPAPAPPSVVAPATAPPSPPPVAAPEPAAIPHKKHHRRSSAPAKQNAEPPSAGPTRPRTGANNAKIVE